MPATDVIMLGGVLRKGHRYTDGPLALASLARLHPDKAFVTPTAYAPGRGLLTNNQAMAELKRAFLSCAEKTYILMDASKVGARGLMWFARWRSATPLSWTRTPRAGLPRSWRR